MKYIKSSYKNSLASFSFKGSTKTIEKLDTVYKYLQPLVSGILFKIKPLKSKGRPPYHPEILFKMLLVQNMYGLSDRILIDMLLDRLSFRRFVGIVKDRDIPDRAVLVRFRQKFFKNKSPERMFRQLFKKLKKQGIIVKAGSMLDSSIVEAPGKRSRPRKRRDKKAKVTYKHGNKYFGYKIHANIDRDKKLIKTLIVTGANTNDSKVFDKILSSRTTKSVYADKGYASPIREVLLKNKGIECNIMRKVYKKGAKLSKHEENRNRKISKVRARVEHVFGRIKNEFNLNKTKYFNMNSNRMFLTFICLLYNVVQVNRIHANFSV